MAEKISEWESELWSYLNQGDGSCCPIRNHCQVRQEGGWCADDNRERISRLLYRKRISPSSYDFLEHVTPCRIFQLVEMLAQKYLKKGRVRCPPVPTGLISLVDEGQADPAMARKWSLEILRASKKTNTFEYLTTLGEKKEMPEIGAMEPEQREACGKAFALQMKWDDDICVGCGA